METKENLRFYVDRTIATKITIAIVATLGAMCSIGGWVLEADIVWRSYALSPLGLVSLGALSFLAYKCFVPYDQRRCIYSLVFAFVYSAALVVGSNILSRDTACFLSWQTYVAIVALVPYVAILIARALVLFDGVRASNGGYIRAGGGCAFAKRQPRILLVKHPFLLVWAIIMICWLPIFLMAWPGLWQYDCIHQTEFLVKGTAIWGHHPAIHTLWMSLPMMASQALVGDYAPGFFVYTLSQYMAVSAAYAAVVLAIGRWNVPSVAVYLALALFCLFPGFANWSVVGTKDVAFTALFALCVVQLFDLMVFRTRSGKRAWSLAWLTLLFFMLFRNNAVYGFALFAAIVLIACRAYWKQTVAFCGSAILVVVLITGPISYAAGVVPGSKNEMMSVPAAQLARTMLLADDLTDEQKAFIEEFSPNWLEYEPQLSDRVKGAFNEKAFTDDPLRFLRGYLSLGFEHPLIYTDAFLWLTSGLWSPMDDYSDPVQWRSSPWNDFVNRTPDGMWHEEDFIWISGEPKVPEVMLRAESALINRHYELSVPGLASLFQMGTWIWLDAFFCLVAFYCRKRRLLIPALFLWSYWLTLYLGPISLYWRYTMVACACAPLFVCALFAMKRVWAGRPVGEDVHDSE